MNYGSRCSCYRNDFNFGGDYQTGALERLSEEVETVFVIADGKFQRCSRCSLAFRNGACFERRDMTAFVIERMR
ncbi:MAG TPA: hypothetical protein VNT76_15395, partial [Candidatus Binatus sp.]|nr:hypothetical protein [Candidatus Binatus sp.]